MKLTQTLISNIQDIYGEKGKDWLKNLPQLIEQLSHMWNFQFLKPMPDLSYNFVGLVQMTQGQTAIAKISPEGGTLVSEMRWLNCVEKGVPKIYAFDEGLNAYLMEHLQPGHSLKSLVRSGDDEGATRIICQIIRDLQSQHCHMDQFRHLSDFLSNLDDLNGHLSSHLLDKAKQLFKDLTSDRSQDVVLHGDLHHDNILACREGWKAIDPHGYVGDPVAEVGAMIRNPYDCFPKNLSVLQIVEKRLAIFTEELPYDKEKIKAWAFCITALSGAWSVKDHGELPEVVREVMLAIDQLGI